MSESDVKGPLRVAANGVQLFVRVTPRASRNAIGMIVQEADGRQVLRVSVTAVPEDGKANAAVIALLSKAWKLPKSGFSVIAGVADRRKTLLISGAPDSLAPLLVKKVFP